MDSIVDFPTPTRAHIGLGVRDLAASVAFYRVLLGADPVKVREGYAKFETASPPLNLSLNRCSEVAPSVGADHFGVQVKSRAEVVAAHERLRAAGLQTIDENGATCCFAVQDKVWAVDPDGRRWEVFVVLADSELHSLPSAERPAAAADGPAAVGDPGGRRCCS